MELREKLNALQTRIQLKEFVSIGLEHQLCNLLYLEGSDAEHQRRMIVQYASMKHLDYRPHSYYITVISPLKQLKHGKSKFSKEILNHSTRLWIMITTLILMME